MYLPPAALPSATFILSELEAGLENTGLLSLTSVTIIVTVAVPTPSALSVALKNSKIVIVIPQNMETMDDFFQKYFEEVTSIHKLHCI